MSSLRIRTTVGRILAFMVVRGSRAGSGEARAAGSVEQVDAVGREVDEGVVAFAQGRKAVGLELERLRADLEVDNRAVAEVLDALDANREAAVGKTQVAGPDADHDVARPGRLERDRQRRAGDADGVPLPL